MNQKNTYDSYRKWERWVKKENAPGTSQCVWAHNYLDERGIPRIAEAPSQMAMKEETETEVLLQRILQVAERGSFGQQETLRKMCLAWNSVAKRARDLKSHKKPYSFTLGTHIEARLRRVAQQLNFTSLHETLEYLIDHGDQLAAQMKKDTQAAIEAEKAHLRQNYKPKGKSKSIKDVMQKDDSAKIQNLEHNIQSLEAHVQHYSEIIMRQEVLLRRFQQQAGLTDEEIEEEAKKIVEDDLRQRKESQ